MINPARVRSGLAPLNKGEKITRWEYSDARTEPFCGVARPTPDTIDYSFGFHRSGFGGDSPAREALRKRGPLTTPKMPQGPFGEFYPGFDEPTVDFSRFYYTATLVTRGFRCQFRAAKAGDVSFRIITPCNVRIWMNGSLTTQFELTDRPNPYSRNLESHQDFSVSVAEGISEMILELEQLAERDTSVYFSLEYRGGVELYTHLEHPQAATLHRVADMVATLEADRVFYIDEAFGLVTQCPLPFDLTIVIDSYAQFSRGDSIDADNRQSLSATLKAFDSHVSFGNDIHLPTGCFEMHILTEFAGYTLRRTIGSTSYAQAIPLVGKSLAERKVEVAHHTANNPGNVASTAYLLLSRNERMDAVEMILHDSLLFVEERRDCSDFSLLALLRIWQDFRSKLSSAMHDRLRDAILGYRYWLNEPGNDVMWFWSENHILCFHICQYLAGKEFPDELFSNSGWTGRQHFEEAHRRLLRWFDSAEAHGLSECNSSAYYPIDIFALLVLHDGSDNAEMKARSKALADTVFIMAAAHNTGTAAAGAMGRTYEKELLSGPANELSVCVSLAYGGNWIPHFDRVSALFCCSDYEPPVFAVKLLKPERGVILHARYTQGHDHAAKLTLWKSAHAQISSNTEHMTGQRGRQEHLLDVQFAAHPLARIWVNHPGDVNPWSERRPSKLAGSNSLPRVAQHENMGFVIFDLTRVEYSLPFTQLFACPTAFDEIHAEGNWIFIKAGCGCAAIWCSVEPELEQIGLYHETVWRADTLKVGWSIVVDTANTNQEFDSFCAAQRSVPPTFDSDLLVLTREEYRLEFDGAFFKEGEKVVFWPLTNIPQFGFDHAPLTAWTERVM